MRFDALEKVTGRARYASDLEAPGMAHGKLVRSPIPHGRIKRVDASRAAKLQGVICVLTGPDLTDLDIFVGTARKDEPVVAVHRVRYAGEPVAAVAAIDEPTAEEALDLIDVEYEELPAAADIDRALAPGAPLVHDSMAGNPLLRPEPGTNILHQVHHRVGDVEAGFAASDLVLEDSFSIPAASHCAMEPPVMLAQWDRDGLTLSTNSQGPFLERKMLADVFRIPINRVRVIVPYVGGGFGGRGLSPRTAIAAALARKAGRPVRLAYSMEESMLTVRRHQARGRVKTGVTRDGIIVAREIEMYLDTGAYAHTGPWVMHVAADRALGGFRIPNLKIDAYLVHTNTVPAGAMRSFGAAQGTWLGESANEIIAERLGMDSVEFRRKNLLRRGESPLPDMKPMDADLIGDLETLAEASAWKEPPAQPDRGKGIACAVANPTAHYPATTVLYMDADGSVTALVGIIEIGPGELTVVSQIVAQELGISPGRVRVVSGDTAAVPYDWLTAASRVTTILGLALQAASRDLKQQLLEMASAQLGRPAAEMQIVDGVIKCGEQTLQFGEIIARHFGMPSGMIIGRGTANFMFAQKPVFYEVGMGVAEVRVDTETGEVKVLRYTALADVGKAINRQGCEGQERGSATFGFGHTFFEELVFDENGSILNGNMADYQIPRFTDIPDAFEGVLVENQDGPGPFGARGMAEGGVSPVSPAVASAVNKAVGVRIHELPLTTERVWRTLRAHKSRVG